MDGVSLTNLLPGLVYEVPVSLGVFLINQRVAEETVLRDEHPAQVDDVISILSGGVKVRPPEDEGNDRPPRKRRSQGVKKG